MRSGGIYNAALVIIKLLYMQSDEDTQTTLSKWPFIVGDVLLVITALAIAILGDWQLSHVQVASCVIAVALGAGLFVLPYIVEFQVRVREEAEDRSADLNVLKRQLAQAETQFGAISRRADALESAMTDLVQKIQSEPDLSGALQGLEMKLTALDHTQESQSRQLKGMIPQIDTIEKQVGVTVEKLASTATQMDGLAPQLDVLSQALKAKAELDALQALQGELATLREQVEQMPAKHTPTTVVAESSGEPKAETESGMEPPLQKTRKRRTSGSRLLQRAIAGKQGNSSSAVSRIIAAKSHRSVVPAAAEPEAPAKDGAVDTPQQVLDPQTEEQKNVPVAADAQPEAVPEVAGKDGDEGPASSPVLVESVSEEEDAAITAASDAEPKVEQVELVVESDMDTAKIVEPKAELEEPTEVEAVATPDDDVESEDTTENEGIAENEGSAETEDSAENEGSAETDPEGAVEAAEPVAAVKVEPQQEPDIEPNSVAFITKGRVLTQKSNTGVTASVFIGIGNKPFIRGGGAGLNWESGVAMEFEEIGKWTWHAPIDLEAPIEVQLYRNDQDPDTHGRFILKPGQRLELSPAF